MDNSFGSSIYSRFQFLDPEPQLLQPQAPDPDAQQPSQGAALFCYLLGQRQGTPVFYTRQVSGRCDFVAAWSTDAHTHLCPVQIRNLTPSADGSRAPTLQESIDDLPQAYPDSPGLVVVLHQPHPVRCMPSELALPRMDLAGLWVFGAVSAGDGDWCLWGDLLGTPSQSHHRYPGT